MNTNLKAILVFIMLLPILIIVGLPLAVLCWIFRIKPDDEGNI